MLANDDSNGMAALSSATATLLPTNPVAPVTRKLRDEGMIDCFCGNTVDRGFLPILQCLFNRQSDKEPDGMKHDGLGQRDEYKYSASSDAR